MTLPNSADTFPVGAQELVPRPPEPELSTVELVPGLPPRIVGPGRRERDYLKRVAHLEDLLQYERERQRILERELDASVHVERGAQRRLDRLEERMEQSHARERRLAALMGALQRDNELLRQRVLELESAAQTLLPASTEPARRGFWARLFGGTPAPAARRRA
ncbi:MAG: hypothetical protein IT453_10415 [Planctomycetes bacterium]|nr:hypothetical protein [Planctomycetota bacterium]